MGFVPDRSLPDDFPMGTGGAMDCGTCHDPSISTPGLLRGLADGEHICLSCHETAFFADLPDPVRVLMFAGHFDTRGGSAAGIDAFSLRCMVCHDDHGPATLRTASASNFLQFDAGPNNHSIGVEYAEAVRYGGYEPMAMLPDEILLPEGRVGCVSCHVPYSRKHGRAPHTRGGLCLTCHAL
jgi:predicted CXXCH cytochrome family protein